MRMKIIKPIRLIALLSLLISCSADDCKVRHALNAEERKECINACESLKELGCEQAQPHVIEWAKCTTHDDCEKGESCNEMGMCEVSCAVQCINSRHEGRVWSQPKCQLDATTCEEATSCELK